MKISGAIFDMDGTLIDSMYLWEGIGVRYARSQGVEPKPGFEEAISEMSMEMVSEYIQKEYGVSQTADEIREGINRMVEPLYRDEVPAKKGIIAFLEELKRRGIPMCVATATDMQLVELVLGRLDMIKYFEGIYTCTMVGAGKQFPDVYEAALKKLGTPKGETFVFEDAVYAAKTAKAAGFPIAAVYEPATGEDGWRELKSMADMVIEDYDKSLDF